MGCHNLAEQTLFVVGPGAWRGRGEGCRHRGITGPAFLTPPLWRLQRELSVGSQLAILNVGGQEVSLTFLPKDVMCSACWHPIYFTPQQGTGAGSRWAFAGQESLYALPFLFPSSRWSGVLFPASPCPLASQQHGVLHHLPLAYPDLPTCHLHHRSCHL